LNTSPAGNSCQQFLYFRKRENQLNMDIRIQTSKARTFLPGDIWKTLQPAVDRCHRDILSRTGKGADFLGWVDLPSSTSDHFLEEINEGCKRLRELADVIIVIGIGGSYLGARAVIEALTPPFSATVKGQKIPQIIYAGHHMDGDYHARLLQYLEGQEYALIVISKSGTTTEPALAFRLLKTHLEKKYGIKGSRRRIIAITDRARGALKTMADREQYKSYVIPDDVGGRYSVLTPVGLLPLALAGVDVKQLIQGARKAEQELKRTAEIEKNPACEYAAIRYALYESGKFVEVLANYHPGLHYLIEWWKQLYGESEGKEFKGIFPAGVNFTTDLHSLGQYIQEGRRMLFETVLTIETPETQLVIPRDEENLDGMNFLAGKSMHEINALASVGTTLAHLDGGVPVLELILPRLHADTLGQLIYFFEFACALNGYMLGVNPFDQPGVEAYKKNMFALLGKPGFEEETNQILQRLQQ